MARGRAVQHPNSGANLETHMRFSDKTRLISSRTGRFLRVPNAIFCTQTVVEMLVFAKLSHDIPLVSSSLSCVLLFDRSFLACIIIVGTILIS